MRHFMAKFKFAKFLLIYLENCFYKIDFRQHSDSHPEASNFTVLFCLISTNRFKIKHHNIPALRDVKRAEAESERKQQPTAKSPRCRYDINLVLMA